MSQLKRSQQKASEEDRSKREKERGVQVCASKCSDRLDALLLIFVATAVTLSVEFLYNQINHLPSPSSLPTQSVTSFTARTDDNVDVDLIERRSLSKKLKSKSSCTLAQKSSLAGIWELINLHLLNQIFPVMSSLGAWGCGGKAKARIGSMWCWGLRGWMWLVFVAKQWLTLEITH